MTIINTINAAINQCAIYATALLDRFSDKAFERIYPHEGGFDFNSGYSDMLGHTYEFILLGILFALIFVAIPWISSKITPAKWKGSAMRVAFFFVWIYGFVVYDIGMCTGEPISLVTNAPMAALYAFKIFLLDSDISEIHGVFHESWLYSLNFALVHFFAAVISTLFVIKYFGFNISAKFRMWIESRFKKKVDETYVFWGFNDASKDLIESIQLHYKESQSQPKNSYRIIIVRLSNEDDDNPETRTGIGRIFDFLSIPPTELEKLQKLKCLTVGTYCNVSNINAIGDDTDVLKGKLSLKSLNRILIKKTRHKIHLLFLGAKEEDNLHAASLLLKDNALKTFADNGNPEDKREVIFHCHARYNSIHRVIEDKYMSGSLRVKVVDSSHISVENLKLNEDLLPISFVNVEKDATVSSSFNSLVVGFSEVGQDSVKFLYEYGAFVKTGSTDTDVKRSGFHMHVVDKQMGDVAGAFVANAPAINFSMPFISGMRNPNALITLDQMDCQSVEFYHKLESWIKNLNYIVIATDDDELNITLAVRVFKMAVRYRDNMDKLCILTRVHKDDDGHVKEIADYYNRLWDSQNAVENYDGKLATQHKIKRNSQAEMPIHLFGLDKKTYTYDNIIDESMEQQAVDFKERYTASTKKGYKTPEDRDDYAWYVDLREYITCIEGDPQNNPTLSAVMGIRRTQGQDYANCFHQTTKKILARLALEEAELQKDFPWEALTRKFETLEYKVKDIALVPPEIFRILKVLAQTEHLRWNASHEILGYVNQGEPPSRDEVKMHHSCIRNWQYLSDKIQSYDFDIVDMTLNIINPKRPIEK